MIEAVGTRHVSFHANWLHIPMRRQTMKKERAPGEREHPRRSGKGSGKAVTVSDMLADFAQSGETYD